MKQTLGIILAAGRSSRLFPATIATTKQLLPVYDKPLIYYPLSTLMLAGVRDVLIITTREEQSLFQRLLSDGSELGMHFDYIVQDKPEGIAQALTLTNDYLAAFTGNGGLSDSFDNSKYNSVFLILGDNLFYGSGLTGVFANAVSTAQNFDRATTFFQKVKDPHRFGVGVFDAIGNLTDIEEKPANPKSSYAAVGAYVYPINTKVQNYDALWAAGQMKKSARGEYEITDLNNYYLDNGKMNGTMFPRGTSWFDCGTYDSLLESAQYIKAIQDNQGLMIGSPHTIAYERKFATKGQIEGFIDRTGGATKNAYNSYLDWMINDFK